MLNWRSRLSNGHFVMLCVYLCPVNRTSGVLGRGIDRGKLQHPVSGVDDVVPGSLGNQNHVPGMKTVAMLQVLPIFPHADPGQPILNADELVGVRMQLQTDFPPEGNTHHRQLQVISRPQRLAKK